MSLRNRSAQIMLASNFGMVGSASEAAPRETSGSEGCHGGCAPVSDEEVPSVATSEEAYPPPPNLRVMRLDIYNKYFGLSAQLK